MLTIVILLKSLEPHTGNKSTAERIKSYFCSPEFRCLITGANTYEDAASFQKFLQQHKASLVIGIHAFHSGRLLVQSSVPYVIIFGGTDLNEYSRELDKFSSMTEAVKGAKALVMFNPALEKCSQELWMDISTEKFISIPQAVIASPSGFNIRHYLQTNYHMCSSNSITTNNESPNLSLMICQPFI